MEAAAQRAKEPAPQSTTSDENPGVSSPLAGIGMAAHAPAGVRIRVYGADFSGQQFVEESWATDISAEGAHLTLTRGGIFGDVISIKNLENGIEEEFRLAGNTQTLADGHFAWEVEAMFPESRIWGLLPQAVDFAKPLVLRIGCWVCGNCRDALLTPAEHQQLLAEGMISRHCVCCGSTTRWKPQQCEPPTEQDTGQQKIRKHQRVIIGMCVKVQNNEGAEDFAMTRDVSGGGACFVSTKRFRLGEELSLQLRFTGGPRVGTARGRVVWMSPTSDGWLHGVRWSEGVGIATPAMGSLISRTRPCQTGFRRPKH